MSVPFDFDEVFDTDYLFFYEPLLADVTEADVATIWRLLKLEPDMAVLDLACGHGRIANRLAERGARVTGLDATALFLDRARRDAASRGVNVDYVKGDMRLLPWTNERFDRVVSWFTSFGYFDDTDNRRVLQEAHRVLRPDGRLLIENNNLVELLPRWQPAFVTERDGHFQIDRSCFDPTTGRATTERVSSAKAALDTSCSPCACSWPASYGTGCSTPDSPASISSTRTANRLPHRAAA